MEGNYTRKGVCRRCVGAAPVRWAVSEQPGIEQAQQPAIPVTLLTASRLGPGQSRGILSQVVNGARMESTDGTDGRFHLPPLPLYHACTSHLLLPS